MYAKVFSQIYDGTLCTRGPWEALVTFQQMLVLADQEGNVDMTAGAIARRTTIPLEIIEKGITVLLEDDPESRTPTENGKRILPLCEGRAWGWHIVNYKHYRSLKREEDRREYHREYWHTRKNKGVQTDTQTTQHTQPNQPIAEAKAEAEAKAQKEKRERSPIGARLPADWDAPETYLEFCRSEKPHLDPMQVAISFADYWKAESGAKARKVDWFAAWRNWVRREKDQATRQQSGETAWQKSQRERVAEFAPSIARRAPGQTQPLSFVEEIQNVPALPSR